MPDPDIAPEASPEPIPDTAPISDPSEIPDKLYFRIGEVARLAGIKPYVLRFWETEFPSLGPRKSGTGHRLYRRKDVEQVFEIKRLLYEKRFTIEGARKFMDDRAKSNAAAAAMAKGKPKGKARAAAAAASEAAPPVQQYQPGLFDGPPAALIDALRKELKEIADLLK